LLRIYFHIDPWAISEDEFARQWNELKWVLKEGHPKFTFINSR